MNAMLRRRLERAARVRDFFRAHKTDGAGEGTALARLEELLQRAEALAAAFITTARRMLELASAQKELLVSQGMSATLLDDLTAALGEFEQTLEATRAGRRDHVGASADLQAVTKEIAEQVRVLDGKRAGAVQDPERAGPG